jgi:tyrosyl-tRNA synthetase
MQQFFKVIDKDRTEIRWQSEWFGDFHLDDVIQLTSRFTIAQLLARDDFSKRYAEGRPITMTEFLYPLLQAFDSVAIKSDVEFGGNDQKFNLLVGRDLQEMVGQKPQQVFLVPILTGTDGSKKMSKSLGNYIGVAEPPQEIYGKVMSIPDSLIMQYYELLTDVHEKELAEIGDALKSNSVNPMELKQRLAREITGQLYDQKAVIDAEAHFARVVQRKETPGEIKNGTESGCNLRDYLVVNNLASSRSEAKRLIEQGSVYMNGQRTTNCNHTVPPGITIQVGKRRFLKST